MHVPRMTRFAVWLLVGSCGATFLPQCPACAAEENDTAGAFGARHVLVADLGHERIRHAVARRGRDGERIVGWGRRVIEVPFAKSATVTEVVPARAGLDYSNGGCAMDVDGDGAEEIVVARSAPGGRQIEFLWFEPVAGQPHWKEHRLGRYHSDVHSVPHDIQPFHLRQADGTERTGIVAVMARRHLVWYERPADPRAEWMRHDIVTLPRENQSGLQVADVAGRGRADLLCGMFWVECPADPTREAWTAHRFGDWDGKGWGGMAKHALTDLDGDGRPELVVTEAEIPNARLGIFEPPADRTKPWHGRVLDKRLYCPHSLAVADLDGDRRPEIIVGEMTAGGWSFPMNPNPRLLTFHNRGQGNFEPQVLSEGQGIHEMGLLIDPRSGDVRLYGADEIQDQKFPEMNTRISYWTIPHPARAK